MIINTDEIEKLLNEVTPYSIEKQIGVNRQNLYNYKNGKYTINQMTIGLAKQLQGLYNEKFKE